MRKAKKNRQAQWPKEQVQNIQLKLKIAKNRGCKAIFLLIFKKTDIIFLTKGLLLKYVRIHTCP